MALETDGINIPVRIDDSNLKTDMNNTLNDVNHFADDIKKTIDKAGKETVFKMNKKSLNNDIKEIQKELETISKAKNNVSIRMTNTFDKSQKDEIQKHFDFLENRAKELQKKLNFRLEAKESGKTSLKDIDKKIKDINEQINKKRQLQIKNDSTEVFKKAEDDIKKLENELKDLEKVRQIKVEINESKVNNLKSSLEVIKKVSAGIAIGVGGITTALVSSTKQAMGFETQFAEVKTLVGDMSAEGIEGLKTGIIELSKETGILSGESIPALYNAISASVPPENAIEFLQVASKNAIGGVTDLQTSVDGLTSIINAYAMDISEAGNVSDLMFETMKRGKTTIGELSSSYFNVIPTAAAVGVQFSNISAAMATITAQGTPTSVATTQLRQLLVELSSDGGKVAKTFKEISGKSFKEFIASGKNLQDALKLLEKEAKSSGKTLNNLFSSVEAGNASLALTGANAERFTNDLEAMNNALGATDEAFKKIDETPAQRIKKIQATLQSVSLEIGRSLLPVAEKMISLVEQNKDKISKFLLTVGNVFVSITKHGKIAVSIVAGLSASFVALNVALAITTPATFGVAGGIKAITLAFAGLNTATGGIIIAIGALIGGLVLLIGYIDKVCNWLERFSAFLGNVEAKANQISKQAKSLAQGFDETATSMEAGRSEADKLIATYDKLNKKQNRTAEENKQLTETIEEIKKVFPTLADELEKTGGDLEKIGLGHFFTYNESELREQGNEMVEKAYEAYNQAKANREKIESQKATWIGSDSDYNAQLNKAIEKEKEAFEYIGEVKKKNAELDSRAVARQQGMVKLKEDELDYMKMIKGYEEQTTGSKKDDKDKLKELEKEYKARRKVIVDTEKEYKKQKERLRELDLKYYQDVEKELENQLADINKLSETERNLKKKEYDDLMEQLDGVQAKIKQLQKDGGSGGSLIKDLLEYLKKEWQNVLGMAQNVVNSIANIWSTMWDNNLQKVEDTLDKQLKAIEDNLNKQTKAYEKQMKDLQKAEKEREKNIEKIRENINDLNDELGEHETEEVYKRYQEQRQALEDKLAREQEALDENRKAQEEAEEEQKLREEEAQLAKEEAERQAAIKKAEIQRKQAIMDKATGIFNATVALASGIASAVASGAQAGLAAPVMIPLLVSLVTASAAGQIAAIAMTPLPEIPSFSSGGYVPSANEQYFKSLIGSSPNNVDKTLVWAREGERILNANETKEWEYYQNKTNNNTDNSKVININNTINVSDNKNAKELAKLSGREIAKSVVLSITRGY